MKKVFKGMLKLNNISVNRKLLLIYIFCVILPLVLTDSVFIYSLRESVAKKEEIQIEKNLERLASGIYNDLNAAVIIAYNVNTDKALNSALDKKYSSYSEFYEVYDSWLRNALQKNVYIFDQIQNIGIYTNNETLPESSGYRIIDNEVRKTEWFKAASKISSEVLLYPYIEDKHLKLSLLKVLNPGEKTFLKILKIDIKTNYILQSLNDNATLGKLYVNDYEGRVVLTTDNNFYDKSIEYYKSFSSIKTNKDNLVITKDIRDFSTFKRWKLCAIVDKKNLTISLAEMIMPFIILILLNLLFATAMIYLISKSFSSRITILSKHIKKVRKQNFEVIDCDEGKDEIGDLIREFNRMTKKIQELIQDVYEVNLRNQKIDIEKKQAIINALQSQINPHFLFNTLETIRMRSVIKDEHETANIIKYLSKLFRRALTWGRDMITVEEELEYVKDFLNIQKYRFGDNLDYEITIDESVKECIIPKMIVQPFVENSCVHGVEKKIEKGMVTIIAYGENDILVLKVEDNGSGIEEDKLKQIHESIISEDNEEKNIGMKNVIKRLQLIYGEKSKFQIDSEVNVGTTVIIKIPMD